jgi:hypothetical protein
MILPKCTCKWTCLGSAQVQLKMADKWTKRYWSEVIPLASLRAGSLGKENLQGSLWWLRAALQLGCHRSINNNQNDKRWKVELHLYCILSFVSYTDHHWGILKKLKRLGVLQCNISSCTFITVCMCFCRHSKFKVVYYPLTNSVVWNCFVLQYILYIVII